MRTIIKIVLILIAIPVNSFALFFVYANYIAVDMTEPPNDESWLPKERNIDKKDNAYFIFKDVVDKYKIKTEINGISLYKLVDSENPDISQVKQFIDANKEMLAHLETAAGLAAGLDYQDPSIVDIKNLSIIQAVPKLTGVPNIVRLIGLKSYQIAQEGNEKEAIALIMSWLNLFERIQNSNETIMGYLINAATAKGILLNIQQNIIKQSKALTSKQLIELIKDLTILKQHLLEDLIRSYKIGYFTGRNMIDLLAEEESRTIIGKLFQKFLFQPNRSKSNFYSIYRDVVQTIEKGCPPQLIPSLDEQYKKIIGKDPEKTRNSNSISIIFKKNIVGNVALMSFIPRMSDAPKIACSKMSKISGIQLLISIKAYYIDNKTYPASLEDLVPRYIAKIPIDDLTGKSFIYEPEKKMLYSSTTDPKHKDKLTFSLDFPEVKKVKVKKKLSVQFDMLFNLNGIYSDFIDSTFMIRAN